MKSRKCEELSNLEKHILNDLLQNPRASQDEIWLKTNENRLKKLEQGGYVKRKGQLWYLTAIGTLCAVIAEGQL